MQFADFSGFSEFGGGNFLESWDDACAGCHGHKFDVHTAYPADCWQFVLEEEMVGLVVETPLTECDGGAGVFDGLHHVCKVLLFLLIKLFIILRTTNIQIMFSLGFWWLKRTSQNANFSITNLLRHLRM